MPAQLNNTTAPGTGGYWHPSGVWQTLPQRGRYCRNFVGDRGLLPRWGVTVSWPRNTALSGCDPSAVMCSHVLDNSARWDDRVWHSSHGHPPYRISGTVKNGSGTALAGAKIKLFKTRGHTASDQTIVGDSVDAAVLETVSAGSAEAITLGSYGFGVHDNTTQHYIRAVSSDGTLVGTTVDTLVGS